MSAAALAADPAFSFEVAPTVVFPLGDTSSVFSLGGGTALEVSINPWIVPVNMRGGIRYTFATTGSSPTLSLISASLGAGYDFTVAPFLSVCPSVEGGLTFGFFNPPLRFRVMRSSALLG